MASTTIPSDGSRMRPTWRMTLERLTEAAGFTLAKQERVNLFAMPVAIVVAT